ncbi:MAG: hypothetical protein JWQ48_2441 [Conexibacter sp.]|nr:hypothetical protein [Conexibacter sp.]
MKKLRRSRVAMIGACCALVGAATVPVASLAGITGSTGDGPMVLQSGQASYDYEAGDNISSVNPMSPGYFKIWSRVGDTVQVGGLIDATAIRTGVLTKVYVPLPVASILGVPDCQGTATISTGPYSAGQVYASSDAGHTNECVIYWIPQNLNTQFIDYNLSYRVRD